MSKSFEYPIDIDQAYYAAIGQVTARWAWLEHRLSILIREGFRLDKAAGRALTSGMEAAALLRTLQVLVKGSWIDDQTVLKAVEEFGNEIERRRKRRNALAHGVYGPETKKPGKMYRVLMRSADDILSPDGDPISVRDLQTLASELRVLQERGLMITTQLKQVQRK